jgi:ATP-dependent helicase/nuclease subunit B
MLVAEATSVTTPADRRESARRQADALIDAGRALAELQTVLGRLDRRRTIGGHVDALRRTLHRLRLRPVLAGDDTTMAARRDSRAWERLQQTLATLGGLARELALAPVALPEFLRLVLAALEPQEVEDRAERAGSVRALGILDARGLDFDVVFLLGLDDGTFPAPRAESPLWPDAMRREANPLAAAVLRQKLGARAEGLPLGGLFRTAREGSLEDPFLFFLAISMAERELVLSYPTMNEKGNPTLPSPFIDEVRACHDAPLPETVLEPRALVPPAAECCEVTELVGRAAQNRWTREPAAEPDRLTAALAAASPDLAARAATIDERARIEERRARYFLSPHGGPRKEERADAFVGRLAGDVRHLAARLAAMRWSPTRLETLGTCGFKFYAQYVLGLADEEDAATEVGPMERGTLAHATLEGVLRAHPRLPADAGAVRALAREFAARERDGIAGRIVAKDPALLAVTWRQVAAAMEEILLTTQVEQADLAAAGRTVDYLLETPLEHALADPAGGPPVLLVGTPDRVEVQRQGGAAVGLRVLDYKMSRNVARYAPLLDPDRQLGKTGFQIPVYLLAALAAFPDIPADTALEGGYYLLLADQKSIVKPFPREVLAMVVTRILGLVESARAGRFDVDPEPCDPYCRHRAVCRYQRPPLDDETT